MEMKKKLLAAWLCVYIYIQYTITPCLSMNTNTSLSIQIIPNLIVPNQMVLRKVYHFLLIVQNTRFSGNSFKEHVLLSWLRLLKISGSKQWALWPRVKRKLLVDGSEIRQTHQLRLVVYPIMYKVLYIYIVYIYIYIPGGAGFLPSTVCWWKEICFDHHRKDEDDEVRNWMEFA